MMQQNLLIHSKIGTAGEKSEAKAEVVEIVKELRYPALAIEQVAGYIPEASGDLFKFLSSYKKDWKSHNSRLSKGNRMYYTGSQYGIYRLSKSTRITRMLRNFFNCCRFSISINYSRDLG